MPDAITALHAILRTVHIVFGSAGLALFWIVLALPKGSRAHVRCGKAFAYVAWIVGISAIVSSVWALVQLDSFATLPADAAKRESVREIYRFIFAILLFLSFATLSGLKFGLEAVRKKERHAALRRTSLPFWLAMTGLSAVGLAAFGIWVLATKDSTGGMPWAAYFVPIFAGLIGMAIVVSQLRYAFGPPPERLEWLYQHVRNMCGTGVAFHTAFLVFGANRLFEYQLPGVWTLVPWVAPPAIGTMLIVIYIRRLRRQARLPSAATIG